MDKLFAGARLPCVISAHSAWRGWGGRAGRSAVGILVMGEAATFARLAGVGLILAGIVTLRLAH